MTVVTNAQPSTVGVRDLKAHLSGYLDRVKAGEQFVVTEHGRPVARLTSLDGDDERMAQLIDAGTVRPPSAPRRGHLPRPVRLQPGSPSLDEIVASQRR